MNSQAFSEWLTSCSTAERITAIALIYGGYASGIPCEMLPKELGCGSGMTCWRRLRDWQEAGI